MYYNVIINELYLAHSDGHTSTVQTKTHLQYNLTIFNIFVGWVCICLWIF